MGQDWRVNCKPAFHPTRQHFCSTAARPAPLPGLGRALHRRGSCPRPHLIITSPPLTCREESWPREREAGQHAKANTGGERTAGRPGPETARSTAQGCRPCPAEASSVQSNPTDPAFSGAEVHGRTEPWGSGPARCAASATRWLPKACGGLLENCLSFMTNESCFRYGTPPSQLRTELSWAACLYVWAWTQFWKVSRVPSSRPWRGPWGWGGWPGGVAAAAKLGWGRGLGTSGQDTWAPPHGGGKGRLLTPLRERWSQEEKADPTVHCIHLDFAVEPSFSVQKFI